MTLIVCRLIVITAMDYVRMNPDLKRFGERIRELRLAKGWSQEELAESSGLHRTYIGGVERGERNVGLLNIYALAGALGVPVSDLFDKDKSKVINPHPKRKDDR